MLRRSPVQLLKARSALNSDLHHLITSKAFVQSGPPWMESAQALWATDSLLGEASPHIQSDLALVSHAYYIPLCLTEELCSISLMTYLQAPGAVVRCPEVT